MTPAEIESTYAEAFGRIRQNSDPAVWHYVDFIQRTLEDTLAMVEAQRFRASLLDGMLGTRLAAVGRDGD